MIDGWAAPFPGGEAAGGDDGAGAPDPEALGLVAAREAARSAKDWAEADRLRDELLERGWQVRDSAAGPELVRP